MSAHNIEAGKAYVSVSTRDDTKPGFDRIDRTFSTLSKSIRRQSDLTSAVTAAASAKSAADAVRTLQAQQRAVDKAIPAARKQMFAGGLGAVDAKAAGQYKTLVAQRAQLETQINAALTTQAQLEQAAAAALERQDRIGAIRLARLREATAELHRQQTLSGSNAGAGANIAKSALAAGANQHRITSLGSTAEADKLTRSLSQQHGLVQSQVAVLMSQLRMMRESGTASAAQAPVMQSIRDLVSQRRDLESSINQIAGVRSGLEAKELASEQQVSREKAAQLSAVQQAARQDQIRSAQAAARANAERDAAEAQRAATALGNEQVRLATAQVTAQQRIVSLGSTKEADRLTSSYAAQRDTINAQIPALMSQLRTMRESGAASAAQAPVVQSIRDLVSQRRDLESSINQIAGVRSGLESKELAIEQQTTLEKEKQARLDQLASNKSARDTITAPKRNRDSWNDNGGVQWSNTQGLSSQTMHKYARSVRNVQFGAEGAAAAASRLSRGIGGVGASSGRSQMALQQMVFAVDDAATSYGTGGLAGAVRGAANNLTMVASLMGGPLVFGLTVAATAAVQLYLAFDKTKKPAAEIKKSIADTSEAVSEFSRQAAHAVRLKNALFAKDTQSMREGLGNQLSESSIVTKKLRAELERSTIDANAAGKEKNFREGMVHWANLGVDPRGKVEDARADYVAKEERRAKIQETLNNHLKEEERIRSQLQETTDKQRRLEQAERGLRNQMISYRREINEQNREHQKRLDLQKTEIQYRGRLNELIKEQREEMRKEVDPHGARRKEILQEYQGQRAIAYMLEDPQERAEQLRMLTLSSRKKLRELDQSDPLHKMGRELEGEIDDQQGGRRRAIDQARDRMFELDQQAELNPQQAKQIQQLRGGVMRSLASQLLKLEQSGGSPANSATLANSSEGMRAIIAATSRDSRSPEQQMLKAITEGKAISEEQRNLLKTMVDRLGTAPVLVARSTK